MGRLAVYFAACLYVAELECILAQTCSLILTQSQLSRALFETSLAR